MGGDETANMAYLIAFVTKNNWLNFELPNSEECSSVVKKTMRNGLSRQFSVRKRKGKMTPAVGR
jgi:hypothetical protein